MKKVILFGTILSVFIMVMMPNINAFEYTKLKEKYDKNIENGVYFISNIQKFLNTNFNRSSFLKLIKIVVAILYVLIYFLFLEFNYDLFGSPSEIIFFLIYQALWCINATLVFLFMPFYAVFLVIYFAFFYNGPFK